MNGDFGVVRYINGRGAAARGRSLIALAVFLIPSLESDRNLWEVEIDQIVAELSDYFVARGLTIGDLHARKPGLCAASIALVS